MAGALQEASWKKLLKSDSSIVDAGLGDVLKNYAKLADDETDERLETLEQIVTLVDKAKKQNAKSPNKAVVAHLDEVAKEARQEKERLEKAEPDAASVLNDEQAYGAYLRKSLGKLKKKPLYFAAGLGRAAGEHRIVFHAVQDGKKLAKTLKDATDLKKLAWGLAGAHAQEKTTVTLGLESQQIGGLKKRLEQLFKFYVPLPFDTIFLMVDGQFVEDLPDTDEVAMSPTSTSSIPPPPDPEAFRFAQRLKPLKLGLDKLIAGASASGPAVQQLYSEAAQAFKRGDYAAAHAWLDQLATAVKRGLEELADKARDGGDPGALFNERLKGLTGALKAAAGTPAGDAARLKASEAGMLARKQDFAQANLLLDQAEAALRGGNVDASVRGDRNSGSTPDTSEIAPGIVEKRKFLMTRWQQIPPDVRAELAKLHAAIEQELPEEDADLLIELSEDYLQDLFDDMRDAIDDAINAGDPQYRSALQAIEKFRARLPDEPLIQHLRGNTLKATVDVEAVLRSALDEVAQALAK